MSRENEQKVEGLQSNPSNSQKRLNKQKQMERSEMKVLW